MHGQGKFGRSVVSTAALALLLIACSGGGVPRHASVQPSDLPSDSVAAAQGESSDPSKPSTGRRTSLPSKGSKGAIGSTSGSAAVTEVFGPSEDRIGITPSTITLCTHAPFVLLPVAGLTSTDDADVYWNLLNDQGGVQGRKVNSLYTDDQHNEQGTQTALESCREKSPFYILSGNADADLLASARSWAERTRTLYYFNTSTEQPTRRFSYSPFTSIETISRFAAQWILKAHGGQRIGLVYRQGISYEPGVPRFQRTLDDRGVKTAVEVSTTKDQVDYGAQISALKGKADVVFVLDDALAETNLIKQARQQGYAPQWVGLYPFNLTTDTLGSDAVLPHPIESIALWPPYRAGVSDGRYARYGDQVRRFEDAFKQYRGRPASSDLAWLFWSFWHITAQQFDRCGRECTRNKFLAVKSWEAQPFCPIDFRGSSNFGGNKVSISRAYAPAPGLAAWAEVPEAVCQDHF